MKEYIYKEDLLEHIHQRILAGNYQEPEDVYSDVDNFPTVTKADICREFADILKEYQFNMSEERFQPDWFVVSVDKIEEILVEMEEEEYAKEYDTKEYADLHPEWAEKIKRLAEMEKE